VKKLVQIGSTHFIITICLFYLLSCGNIELLLYQEYYVMLVCH